MTTATVPAAKNGSRAPYLLLSCLSILLLAGAAYLWVTRPVRPVAVEGGARPVGFSAGLDDPDVARVDRQGARAFWQNADRVLPNGFAAGVGKLWPDLERAAPDLAVAPVKIVPTGGLFPFYRSSTFAAEIAAFVRGGGSLICFGQPLGAMYGALPGAPQGVGWAEMACQAREATGQAQVATDHPALAALSRGEFDAHFGGFLTRIPGTDQTQVILRDTSTGRPILVAYRYGRGLVVASTLVSDAAALSTGLGREEKKLWQELLVWAQAGNGDLPQYAPGDSIEMAHVLEPGEIGASDGFVEVHRPDGTMESFNCPLPAEGVNEVIKPFTITEPRGLWRIVSYRRDASGQAAGPATSAWFAVGHAPETIAGPGFHATISVPSTHVVAGSVLPILVRLWNDSQAAMEITYRGPAGKHTVKLADGQSKLLRDEISVSKPGTVSIAYEFFGQSGEKLGVIKRRLEAGEPDRVFMTMPAAKSVASGQVVSVDLQVLSVNPGAFMADCRLRLVHNGKLLWQEPRRLELSGAYSTKYKIEVPVPPGETGRLVLEATLLHGGRELAQTWTELLVQ